METSSQPEKLELHIEIEREDLSAVDWLGEHSNLSRQQIKQAMQKGAVWLSHNKHTQRLRRASRTLPLNDTLHLYYSARVLNETPALPVLIQDEQDFSVWYKPFGLRSQGSKWGDHCTITRCIETSLTPQRPVFLVHRLDRAASGLMLVAHSKKMAAILAEMFARRQVDKHYHVIVQGEFTSDKTVTFDAVVEDKQAISHATRLANDADKQRSLLEVKIETGRKHQIRRHLAGAGFPVVGDRLYAPEHDWQEDLQLCACRLSFSHPINGTKCDVHLPDSLDIHI